jgi:WD40 repeat protein
MTDFNPPLSRPEPSLAPAAPDTNPYIGPRAFEEKDSENFFGRSREIRELASLVIAHRAVLFYAQSGAGKTSLLQAGLLPRLRERKKINTLPICRVGGDLPPGILRTEVQNIYVFNLLLNLLGQQVDPRDLIGLSLVDGLRSFFAAQNPIDAVRPQPRLLILDQFEELFTTHLDRYPERANFFLQLQQALAVYPQLSLLLVMREDHIAHLDSYAAQMPDRLRIRYRMERLYYEVALEAVKEPAGRAGVPFAPGVAEDLIDNLRRIQAGGTSDSPAPPETAPTETIIRLDRPLESFTPAEQERLRDSLAEWLDLSPAEVNIGEIEAGSVILHLDLPPAAAQALADMVEAGDPRLAAFQLTQVTAPPAAEATALGTYIEPVHLQIVCRQLWASLPPERAQILAADVQEFGDVDQALIDFYEQALAQVVQQTLMSQRLVRLWFDSQLITPARTRGVIHRGPEETAGLPNEAVAILNNAYIIRGDVRGNDMWYELTHDRLVEPIITANQRWLATYRNPLAAAHTAWLAAGRDPQKLLTGSQLNEAEAYARDFPVDVTEEEQHFLAESRFRAKQTAQRRRNLMVAAVAVIIMLSLCAVTTWINWQKAEDRFYEAQAAKGTAEMQKATAEAAEGIAIAANNRAATAKSDAFFERDQADMAKAEAIKKGLEAQTAAQTAEAEENRAATAAMEARYQEGQANQQKATAEAAAGTAAAAGGTAEAERDIAATAEALANQQKATALAAGQTAEAERDIAATAQAIAEEQRAAAAAAQAEAEAQRAAAQAAEADARAALEDAEAAEATAQAERDNASAAAATAQAERDIAATAQAEAETQETIAFARQLIEQAFDLTATQPELAMLLSVEAVRIMEDTIGAESPEMQNSLRRNILQVSGIKDDPLTGHDGYIRSLTFSPDGQTLASGSYDKTVKLWDVSNPITPTLIDTSPVYAPPTSIHGHGMEVEAVAFSSDGQTLASGAWDSTIGLWDTSHLDPSTLNKPTQPIDAGHQVLSLTFSPGGETLASSGYDGTIKLWNVPTGTLITATRVHTSWVRSVAFSPDGKTLASGSNDETIKLWDVSNPSSPQLHSTLNDHSDNVNSVAFSPDGQTLASGSWDGTIKLWDVSNPSSPQLLHPPPLEGLEGAGMVSDLAFSPKWPDTKMLVSARYSSSLLLLWDVSDYNKPIAQSVSHASDSIQSLAFSPDGNILASGSQTSNTNTIRLWPVAYNYDSLSVRACNYAGRNLKVEEWDRWIGDWLEDYAERHMTCDGYPLP